MKGDAAIQFEHESFRRYYKGIFFSLCSQEDQVFLLSGQEAVQETGPEDRPEEALLVLDTISVSVFPGTKRIKVTGFSPNGRGSFYLCQLDFRPF